MCTESLAAVRAGTTEHRLNGLRRANERGDPSSNRRQPQSLSSGAYGSTWARRVLCTNLSGTAGQFVLSHSFMRQDVFLWK
ncbi:hypothetical protein [Filifactor villosus]|uniref:Uncharacterized protein n=1 Tax=Filifactor villosus TaxID=29374 RepID=A0ABV9QSL3_9FIRM